MAETVQIDALQLELKANGAKAANSITKLVSALSTLKTTTATIDTAKLKTLSTTLNSIASLKGTGIGTIGTQLKKLGAGLSEFQSTINPEKISKIAEISQSLSGLGTLKEQNVGSIGTQLKKLASGITQLNGVETEGLDERLEKLVQSLGQLGGLGDIKISSFATALKKLPSALNEIHDLDLDAVAEDAKKLATALSPLAKYAFLSNTNFRNLNGTLGTSKNHFGTTNITIGKMTATLGKLSLAMAALPIKSFLALYVVIRKVLPTIQTWVSASNKYQEDLNLFTASLGRYAESAKEYAEEVAEIMGIDPAQWMRNQGVFNTIIKGFGVAADRAALMSEQLTQLGYDLSSFYNIEVEEAMTKLTSGISGELEPLRRLGYDLSVARLEQERFNLGITKSVNDMTQAEKAQLRYYAIMTQVTTAQGDMSRTLEAPANQIRIMKAQLTQLSRAMGNIFIPAINSAMPYLIAFTKAVRTLADYIANLLGFELTEVDYSGLEDTASATDDITDAFDGATASAKKFKNFLLGIDELNVMPDTSDSGSGYGDGSTSGWIDFELPTYDFIGDATSSRVNEIYNQIIDTFKGKDFYEIGDTISTSLGNALKRVDWDEIKNDAKKVGKSLASLLNGLFNPETGRELGRAVGGLLSTGLELSVSFLTELDFARLGKSLAENLNGIFETLDTEKLAEAVNAFANGVWDLFCGLFENLDGKKFINALKGLFTNLSPEAYAVISGILAYKMVGKGLFSGLASGLTTGGGIATGSVGGTSLLTTITSGVLAALAGWNVGKALYTFITGDEAATVGELVDTIKSEVENEGVGGALMNATGFMTESGLFGTIPMLVKKATDSFDAFIDKNNEAIDNFTTWSDPLSRSSEQFAEMLDNEREREQSGFDSAVAHYAEATKDFTTNIAAVAESSAINSASLFVERLDTTFSSTGNPFDKLISNNSVKTFTKTGETAGTLFANGFSKSSGFLSGFLNNISDTMVTTVGNAIETIKAKGKINQILSVAKSYIPGFATGGFPEDGLFYANHNEMVGSFSNGRTAVANNGQIIEGITAGVRSAMLEVAASGAFGSGGNFTVMLDGREMFNSVVEQNNRAINRTGASPLKV